MRFASLCIVAVVVVASCSVDRESDSSNEIEPRRGGSVVVAVDTEPDVLNTARSDLAVTAELNRLVTARPYEITRDLRFVPSLIDGEARITEDPFTITYRIRDDAAWSDGKPITASDFEFTWETMIDPENDVVIREGLERIEDAEVVDRKTITFHFSRPYAAWKLLFMREGIFPAHELEGKDFDKTWNEGITLSAGPFVFTDWVKGSRITFERNPNYFGRAPYLDRVVFRFVTNTQSLIQALRGQEIDVGSPQAQEVPALEAIGGVEFEVSPGSRWEFLKFRTAVIPRFVRRTIAHAVDRDALVEVLARPALPNAGVLDSIVYLRHQEEYEPHFSGFQHDPEAAEELLRGNGCTRGDDGIFVCGEKRLSYRVAAISGRERSRLGFEIIQEQLRNAGIALESSFGDIPAVVQNMLSGRVDATLLSIDPGPDPPSFALPLTGCGGNFNLSGYCNARATHLLERAGTTIDPTRRAELYNRAGAIVAEDVPLLPLYQVPEVLVWRDHVKGVVPHLGWGPTGTVEEWFIAR